MHYERLCQIERAEGDAAGVVSGTLATDGEASDGHILNIHGVNLPSSAPLLFGHDDWSGKGNLGSWTSFEKYGDGNKLGRSGIKGTAEIELQGEGNQAEWRQDIAHMIDQKHIRSFSIRWAEIDEPVYRTNLPSDHPAFVDVKKAKGRKRWGLWFEKWRLLEGSIVTLGADPSALIGRMQEANGDLRQFWRGVVNDSMGQTFDSGNLVGVQVGEEVIYVERAVHAAMLEASNDVLHLAVDALQEAVDSRECANEMLRAALEVEEERSTSVEVVTELPDDEEEEEEVSTRSEPEEVAVTEPQETQEAATLPAITTPSQVIRLLHTELSKAREEMKGEAREIVRHALGKVS
jgi:hypothetical protein